MDVGISKVLQKRGIKDISELTAEEKEEFDRWQTILKKEDTTIKDVIVFCESQIDIIESAFKDIDTPTQRMERLVLQHSIYKALIAFISGPQKEKEQLRQYLTSQLS